MRIALGQFNAVVGDVWGNAEALGAFVERAADAGCDMVVFPEMCICGYPPEDLLLKKHFLIDNQKAVETLAGGCGDITVVAGFAEWHDEMAYNSLGVMRNGRLEAVYRKCVLPNYGVFDEKRYFHAGGEPLIIEVKGVSVALTICEDIWQLDWLAKFLEGDKRKDLIVNISASPFHLGKIGERQEILSRCAKHFGCAVGYCNLVGGQDELVFDGRSMFVDASGQVTCRAKAFDEDLLVVDVDALQEGTVTVKTVSAAVEHPCADAGDGASEVYEALVLGTRDYVRKNGFEKVLIGLSGGIDSSLTAAIAVAALGAENVVGVTMPSRFNLAETRTDAQRTAENLGMSFHTAPIEDALGSFHETLKLFEGWDNKGVAYENLQARIRGTILMSLSNQFSYLVLTTGNKSETAVGYSTLYGDTAGGFAVIKDVPKTMVYELAEHVNRAAGSEVIPVSVINRPPSAELRDDQKDSDSLPDYDLLDTILKGYIEEDKSPAELTASGLDAKTVKRIARLVDLNEYKRRQSPPGVRITPKAFGKDRRMPITNHYR
ncbi:MAG: NAD+ synthase [Planctomycetes bacterium]|nr:NAD+ synthase [Planctomycetota bacterium]